MVVSDGTFTVLPSCGGGGSGSGSGGAGLLLGTFCVWEKVLVPCLR